MDADAKNLPQDLASCHALIGGLVAELGLRDRKLQQLQHQLEQLLRWRYGRKRERMDENQLFFEALQIVGGQAPQPEAAAAETPNTTPPSSPPPPPPKGHGRKRLPAHLKRKRQEYDVYHVSRGAGRATPMSPLSKAVEAHRHRTQRAAGVRAGLATGH
jgi:hypothetical protein